MIQFKNIFTTINLNTKINFKILTEIRRKRLHEEGHFTDGVINWEHYTKVLEAKQRFLAAQN